MRRPAGKGSAGQMGNSYGLVVNVVLTYWAISITMVFFNKMLVGDRKDKHDLSLFVSWMQCIVTVVVIQLYSFVAAIFRRVRPSAGPTSSDGASDSSSSTIDFRLCFRGPVLFLSLLYVGMLAFNNLCLKLVGVAFFQIARSMTLIFTVVLSSLVLRRHTSLRAGACCGLVVVGFIVGIDQEGVSGTLSTRGVIYGLITSLFVALVGIYTKKALDIADMDSIKITLYNNFNASFIFLGPMVLTGDLQTAFESGKVYDTAFWVLMVASGVLGFLVAWASARQIEHTSPITHHISNNAKAIVQTLIAVAVYDEAKTALWWSGCVTVIVGAFLYAYVKMKEEAAPKPVLADRERQQQV